MENWLRKQARINPSKIALYHRNEAYSFGKFNTDSDKLFFILKEKIMQGDRVAVMMGSSPLHLTLMWTLGKLKAIYVPINLRFKPQEIRNQIDLSQSKLIIFSLNYEKIIRPIVTERSLVAISEEEISKDSVETIKRESEPLEISPQDPLAIIFTSGTTGVPKGAVFRYENISSSAMDSKDRLGHEPDDIWLLTIPLYHIGGLSIIYRSMIYGTSVRLLDKFDEVSFLKLVGKRSFSIASLVPSMLQRLITYSIKNDLVPTFANLRYLLIGGDSTPPHLIIESLNYQIPITITYGMTEASSQISTLTHDELSNKIGSSGRPLQNMKVEIMAAKFDKTFNAKVGEIAISGPSVISEYLNADLNKSESGAFLTGDIGYFDNDGYLYVLQRRTDLIVTGGENVYPKEVELILLGHPLLKEVAIVGIDDANWGQSVAAMVIPEDGKTLTHDDISSYLKKRIATFKIPKIIAFMEELPLLSNGKVDIKQVKNILEKISTS